MTIRPDQIPQEVWRSAMSVYHKEIRRDPGNAWQAAIAAALAAWPGIRPGIDIRTGQTDCLIVPLPETSE